jgi:tetratricopeptide (TPR) repeat protein
MATLFVLALCELAVGAPDTTLAQAEALMYEAEYLEAERILARGLSSSRLSHAVKTKGYWLLGVCYVSLGRLSSAKTAFQQLLALSPSFEPESTTSPKILAAFYDAKEPFRFQPKVHVANEIAPSMGLPVEFSIAANDHASEIKRVILHVRRVGSSNFTTVDLLADLTKPNAFVGQIPSQKNDTSAIEYYVEALSASQGKLCGVGTRDQPLTVWLKDFAAKPYSPFDIQAAPITWPYWAGAGAVLLVGIIYAAVSLTNHDESNLRIVVYD